MDMKILERKKQLCLCCMEEHEVKTVALRETNIFKGISVEYDATYYYCDRADELLSDEVMISANDISMKDSYRKMQGLLTSSEIQSIRGRYGITQSDLCLLLGWGAKTVTRYESHQVQDIAHDTILRKLNDDPEWFICLLNTIKNQIGKVPYHKYLKAASQLYASDRDLYLERAIKSKYANLKDTLVFSGNVELCLDKVIDAIRFFSNSDKVSNLYKVKLMKLLWYADALSFKRRDYAITGLVYQALPMGAVPVGHESIIDFSRINCEEVDFGEGTGYHFLPTSDKSYNSLAKDDIIILEDVVRAFGTSSKDEIVQKMHQEVAFKETAPRDMIPFKYTKYLSIS